jgi:hypothetical protein
MAFDNNKSEPNLSNFLSPNAHNLTTRRKSSIFPAYLRRKSARKDSVFASESTTPLWPFSAEDKLPNIFGYRDSNKSSEEEKFKFGWINGVYVSL